MYGPRIKRQALIAGRSLDRLERLQRTTNGDRPAPQANDALRNSG
jgi:hypothetical protein